MRIAIIGAGNVGKALGAGWLKSGHSVTYGLRNPVDGKAQSLRSSGAQVASIGDAGAEAEVLILAVPWDAVPGTIRTLGDLKGKILVDATNPLTANLELAVGHGDSAGETVGRLAPAARVVKAFNTTGAGNMADSRYPGGKLMMAVAGDEADAKRTVMSLATELGFEPVDFGPLSMSRHLEPLAMLWIKLAYAQKLGTNIGFALLRR